MLSPFLPIKLILQHHDKCRKIMAALKCMLWWAQGVYTWNIAVTPFHIDGENSFQALNGTSQFYGICVTANRIPVLDPKWTGLSPLHQSRYRRTENLEALSNVFLTFNTYLDSSSRSYIICTYISTNNANFQKIKPWDQCDQMLE